MNAESFWDNVDISSDRDVCWEWKRSRYPSGYGRVNFEGKMTYAHRIAYQLAAGVHPGELHVCHKCDNPVCCNPDHLWLGTEMDNMRDRSQKGRNGNRKGMQNRKILSWDSVREIRDSWNGTRNSASTLAKTYKVTYSCIYAVVFNISWHDEAYIPPTKRR
jgi:hypothetical protein